MEYEPSVFTPDEARQYMKMSQEGIAHLMSDGKLPFTVLSHGSKIIIKRADRDRFLRRRKDWADSVAKATRTFKAKD